MRLSDKIEQIILELLDKQELEPLTLSRNQIADYLGCAPSQVTYVVNTRFSEDLCSRVKERKWRLYSNFFITTNTNKKTSCQS